MKRKISLFIPYRRVIDDVTGIVKNKTFFSICENCKHGHRTKARRTSTSNDLQNELERKGLKLNLKRYFCSKKHQLVSFPKECKHYERKI